MNNLSASAHSANPSIDSRLVQKVSPKKLLIKWRIQYVIRLSHYRVSWTTWIVLLLNRHDHLILISWNHSMLTWRTRSHSWSVYHIKLSQLSDRSSVILARWSRRVSRTLLELTVDQMKLTGLHLQWIIRSMLLSLGLLRTDSPVNGVGMSTKFWPLLQDGMWRLAMRFG